MPRPQAPEGDPSESRLRRRVTSWFPGSSRCAQTTVLSTSLVVALCLACGTNPLPTSFFKKHSICTASPGSKTPLPSSSTRARARVLLGLTWGSGPALLVVGTAPASPVRPPASTPAPEGTLPTPRPPHAVACRLPYFLHSTGNCLVQLFTMLLSEYLQDANSRRVALLSVPDIAQVAQGNNTR